MKRQQVEEKYKWRLEDIYESDDLWEKDFSKLDSLCKKVLGCKGHIGENGKMLRDSIKAQEDLSRVTEKLYVYAHMRRDEDNACAKYQEFLMRVEAKYAEIGAALAFFTPEITKIPKKTVEKYMEEYKPLQKYAFYFEELFRDKAHVLSEKEERIMALAGESMGVAGEVFTMFNDADLRYGKVKNEKGKSVELTKGLYSVLMSSKNRDVRREAFAATYKAYSSFRNTLSSCYSGQVKTDCFCARARNYKSALSASLFSDNVPETVYDNLIKAVRDSFPKLYRYYELKKKVLGLSSIHLYDMYVPLSDAPEKKYTFEEAKEIVLSALSPMGREYCSHIREAFDGRWIDVCETEGKTSGAYSWGCYDSHPYVLLNWQGKTDDVFTLAHELGHAMHTYYSNKKQDYTYASYRIFVAEVASTVNENLLMKYMLEHSSDRDEKLYLLGHYLEEIRLTIVRQVMFGEFEKITHEKYENGEALSCELLCDIYYNLNRDYFGKKVCVDRDIAMEWARVPHFYNAFYVYKYAIGFSAAMKFADNIKTGDKALKDKYIEFLSKGCSEYPLDILKKAGVDMEKPDAVNSAMEMFGKMTDEYIELYASGKKR